MSVMFVVSVMFVGGGLGGGGSFGGGGGASFHCFGSEIFFFPGKNCTAERWHLLHTTHAIKEAASWYGVLPFRLTGVSENLSLETDSMKQFSRHQTYKIFFPSSLHLLPQLLPFSPTPTASTHNSTLSPTLTLTPNPTFAPTSTPRTRRPLHPPALPPRPPRAHTNPAGSPASSKERGACRLAVAIPVAFLRGAAAVTPGGGVRVVLVVVDTSG